MIHYQITPTSLSEHTFEVKMTISKVSGTSLNLCLPSWIPGSYMVRDFAQHIVKMSVTSGNANLLVLDKQSWLIESTNGSPLEDVTLTYIVFAFDFSVRSAYINDEYAFFNGTSAFIQVEGFEQNIHKVEVDVGTELQNAEIVTSMPIDATQVGSERTKHYICESYSELIDHPVIMGSLLKHQFDVDGVTFHLVFTGDAPIDLKRIEKDLAPICQHHMNLFGEMPIDEYWFITLLSKQAFGGLEHKSSTVLQFAREELPFIGDSQFDNGLISDGYQDFLSLCSHELFHLWHVKRNQPDVFVNPDLSKEVYTKQLWIYEGFTSLYDDLSLARCKTITAEKYLQVLSKSITRLLRNPGRLKQSVAQSSFDAWTKFYKQTPSSVNHIVSYYLKGSLVALCLDIRLRQLTNNEKSLDDVMRILWKEYGSKGIGTTDSVIHDICQQHFNVDIASYLDIAVDTTMELPFIQMLDSIGVRTVLRGSENFDDKGGKPITTAVQNEFGCIVKDSPNGVQVKQVLESASAALAGLQLEDVIIAVDHWQVNSKQLHRHIHRAEEGNALVFHVLRDGRLLALDFPVRRAIPDTCELYLEDADKFQQWLHS